MHILHNACSILYCWCADWCWHIQERQSLVLDFTCWIFYVATLKRKPANFFLSLWKLLDDSQGHCQFFFFGCLNWECLPELIWSRPLAVITDNASSQLPNRSQNFQKAVRKLQDVEDNVRISTWWPAMPIILFAIPTLYLLFSHVSDYNMFNCFPRLYSEPIRPACCPVTMHTSLSAACSQCWM